MPTRLPYFAYGSNMLTERLQARVPSARPVGVAELRGYGLRFHKRSGDGSAKCSVRPQPGGSSDPDAAASPVVGVCFELDGSHLPSLDDAEARGNGYRREIFEVASGGYTETVFAYVAQADFVEPDLRPYHWYKALVVAGAMQHDLPSPYVAHLRSVDAVRDPDDERRSANWQLVRDAGFAELHAGEASSSTGSDGPTKTA